ncbi:hypothetical protein LTR65_008824 [Meristemomyces frigidus]
MLTHAHIHWLAPVSMLSAFVAGILFAVGHHVFYQRLDTTHVPADGNTILGPMEVSMQQVNHTAGTAFAFIVKACLTTAVSSAFIQTFWKAVTAVSLTKRPTLGRADTAYSGVNNIISLFNAPVWWPNAYLAWYGDLPFTSSEDGNMSIGSSELISDSKSNLTVSLAVLPKMLQNAVTLSYQAILQAFTDIITGNIANKLSLGLFKNSSVVSTTLLNTKELSFLSDRSIELQEAISYGQPDLQAALANSSVGSAIGLTPSEEIAPNQSLIAALEEMFQNYTVSLMSSALLQYVRRYYRTRLPLMGVRPNISLDVPRTMVTEITFHNVYAYSRSQLWLAYGLAILCTAIAVVLGFCAILSNGASYSNNFSTIVRSARNAELSVDVKPDDTGRDPLPRGLAQAVVLMPTNTIYSASRHDTTKEAKAVHISAKKPAVTDPFLPSVTESTRNTSS